MLHKVRKMYLTNIYQNIRATLPTIALTGLAFIVSSLSAGCEQYGETTSERMDNFLTEYCEKDPSCKAAESSRESVHEKLGEKNDLFKEESQERKWEKQKDRTDSAADFFEAGGDYRERKEDKEESDQVTQTGTDSSGSRSGGMERFKGKKSSTPSTQGNIDIANSAIDKIGAAYGEGTGEYVCTTLVRTVAEENDYNMGSAYSGDEIYARHTDLVTTMSLGRGGLKKAKPGDIVFFGEPSDTGEGGVSIWHLGILTECNGSDCSFVHAAGEEIENPDGTTSYEGLGVVETDSLRNYSRRIGREDDHKRKTYIGRLKN